MKRRWVSTTVSERADSHGAARSVHLTAMGIEWSSDGEQWTRVYDGFSSGETLEHELYPIRPTRARYVRICVGGKQRLDRRVLYGHGLAVL